MYSVVYSFLRIPLLPERLKIPAHRLHCAASSSLPFLREQALILPSREPVIQKQDHPTIVHRPDHTSSSLQYLIHPRVAVCIIKSFPGSLIIIMHQDLTLIADLWKPGSHNHCPISCSFLRSIPSPKIPPHHAKARNDRSCSATNCPKNASLSSSFIPDTCIHVSISPQLIPSNTSYTSCIIL